MKVMSYLHSHREIVARISLDAGRNLESSPSDLLLPEHLLLYAANLANKHGRWRDLIAFLVQRHRARILKIAAQARNVGFRYQADGQNLQRVSYLPYRDMRVELRALSYAARISMCALVVLMLEWERESEEDGKNHEVTMSFESSWTLKRAILTVYARIEVKTTHPPPGT